MCIRDRPPGEEMSRVKFVIPCFILWSMVFIKALIEISTTGAKNFITIGFGLMFASFLS